MKPMTSGLDQMIRVIQHEMHTTRSYTGMEQLSHEVEQALREVPREAFVPDHLKSQAYDNGPLPIGHGQTISQPYIVALMSELLQIKATDRILEIGTGSGYQTALLSRLCQRVYTMERIGSLLQSAQTQFEQLHYTNIDYRLGNGYAGWPENAPYQGIIVTAAASEVPAALTEQLALHARLVIPIGLSGMHQELMVIEKTPHQGLLTRRILGVAFVPLLNQAPD